MEVVNELRGQLFKRPNGPWLQSVVLGPCYSYWATWEGSAHDCIRIPMKGPLVSEGIELVDGADRISLSIVRRYLR